MFTELKNLSLEIKALQESKLGLTDALIRLTEKKAETLKNLVEIENEIESKILFGDNACEYKNDKARKAAIKAELEINTDYIQLNQTLENTLKTFNGVELDQKRMQIEISYLQREFEINLACVTSKELQPA